MKSHSDKKPKFARAAIVALVAVAVAAGAIMASAMSASATTITGRVGVALAQGDPTCWADPCTPEPKPCCAHKNPCDNCVSGIEPVSTMVTLPPGTTTDFLDCPAGKVPISGGYNQPDTRDVQLTAFFADPANPRWVFRWVNYSSNDFIAGESALCVNPG